MRTGAELLVDQLILNGVDTAFGVPGESYLAVLDAMHDRRDRFRFVACRQEGGAAFMAEAWGKLSNAPGVCFVTRGPGATNASIGVHTAMQDSTPMILFIGQVGSVDVEREAFQEIDYRRFFSPICKWAAQIDRADRVPEFVQRAFAVAMSGRPGPVVLALPEDMLVATSDVLDARTVVAARAAPAPSDVARLAGMLAEAERPLAILGGPGWSVEAARHIRTFLERCEIPAVTAFRAKDRLDNAHTLYVGDLGIGADPALVKRVAEADLLLVLGARLDEMTTGAYERIAVPTAIQKLVHVFPDAGELNRVTAADLAICAHIETFAEVAERLSISAAPRWSGWAKQARQAYERFIAPVSPPGAVNPSAIFAGLRERLPQDAILTNGAGNYAGWLHRFHLHRQLHTQLAPLSGAMGYGFPAAIAAKLKHPERVVIANSGDGCFLMNGQEMATAVQYGANIISLVWDNGSYGTIRMHQERNYPGRVSGTDLVNPDFAALARSYGAAGFTVEKTADFEGAFEAALASGKPALIHIKTDVEAITPTTTISALRAAAKG
ncbi:Acetolactate synthase isozyme 2 large subunit [Alphaproteobacteria bacterium SO-S41]|nr:Acetolactate synthase isozyme 2 large subunit [Alphaproteobacteria bacterium SO-S41]